MKLYAVIDSQSGKWIASAGSNPLVLDDPDFRCFRSARSARALIRRGRNDWPLWKARCGLDPAFFEMVEVSATIDFGSIKKIPLPEDETTTLSGSGR